MKDALKLVHTPFLESLDDPAPEYRALAVHGPVRYVQQADGVGALPHYAILDFDLAQQALRDPRISKTSQAMQAALRRQGADPANYPLSGGSGAPNLLNTDGAAHKRLRGLASVTFSPRRVHLLQARLDRLVARLIDQMRGQDSLELVAEFTYLIALNLICDVLGIPEADRGDFRHWATQTMRPKAPDQKACQAALRDYLIGLVTAKKAAADPQVAPDDQPDMLSALCVARTEDGALSEGELMSMSMLLLVAGHETTVGLMGNALILLDRYPAEREKLLADPELIPGAIEEVLRFDGSVHQSTMRATAEDVEIGGVVIPSKSFVHIYIAACNRDPKRWPDPDRFDVTRPPKGSLAFGHGPHMCIGLHLARLEAATALRAFLEVFPRYRLTEPVTWAGTIVRAPAVLRALAS